MTESNLPSKVLLIDDDTTVGKAVSSGLSNYGVELTNCQDINSALSLFNQENFDVIVVESDFDPLPGLVLIQKLREMSPDPNKRAAGFILTSGKLRKLSDEILLKELIDIEVMIKPFSLIQILPVLSRSYGSKKKNLLFENFRAKLLSLIFSNKLDEAFDAVKRNMGKLGERGILLLCEMYTLADMDDQALSFIESVCIREPGKRNYQYTKAKILLKLGRLAEAEPILEIFHTESPNHIERVETLSKAYLEQGKIDKVFDLVKDQVRLNPEIDNIKMQTLQKVLKAGHEKEVHDYCKENSSPREIVKFYNNLGVERSKNGDYAGAISEYEIAIKIFPNSKDNFRLYYNIALAQIKLKNVSAFNAAASNLNKCLELNPTFEKAAEALKNLPSTQV